MNEAFRSTIMINYKVIEGGYFKPCFGAGWREGECIEREYQMSKIGFSGLLKLSLDSKEIFRDECESVRVKFASYHLRMYEKYVIDERGGEFHELFTHRQKDNFTRQ